MALELVRDCHATYEGASAEIRRQFNQAIFEKLHVQQDGDVTHELAEPFKILLDPQLTGCLATGCEDRAAPEGEPLSKENRNGVALCDAGGSHFEILVEHSGIEPLTSWVRSRRSPS